MPPVNPHDLDWTELDWSWRNLQVYVASRSLEQVDLASLSECVEEIRARVDDVRRRLARGGAHAEAADAPGDDAGLDGCGMDECAAGAVGSSSASQPSPYSH